MSEDNSINIRADAYQKAKESEIGRDRVFWDVESMFDGMDGDEASKMQDEIYANYAQAMRRRDRVPLESHRFMGHFFGGGNYEKSVAFGDRESGFLFGSQIHDVFVPTHFAPAGLKQGYKLIKDLVSSDKPTALFITQDLVDTIKKMDGWKILPFQFRTTFRGQEIEKTLVVNKWTALHKLALPYVSSYIRNQLTGIDRRIQEFGTKILATFRYNQPNAQEVDEELKAAIHESSTDDRTELTTHSAMTLEQKLRNVKLFDDDKPDN